jgi:anti-sigma factor RsiW
MTAEELTCQELVGLVTDYLEEALTPEERGRFEAHLPRCPHCRLYLEQMRQTIAALGRIRDL